MDQRLRTSVRAASLDPSALGDAATALLRAGDLAEATRLILEAGDRAGSAIEVLTPASLDALVASIEPHRARAHLEHLAWWPDERGLWVHDQLEFERFEVLRWPLGGAPEAAFGSRDLPLPPARQSLDEEVPAAGEPDEREVTEVRSLVALGDGRLALSAWTISSSGGDAWYVFDPETRRCLHGPAQAPPVQDWRDPTPKVMAGWGDVVLGATEAAVYLWRPGEPGLQEWFRSRNAELAPGTCAALKKGQIELWRPGASEPAARVAFPGERPSKAWSGLVSAWAGRVVVADQEGGQVILLDATGELARAPFPAERTGRKKGLGTPGKLVGVRPCPSGRVVALRYKGQKEVALVDLRSGDARVIPLEHVPRAMVWSPSGRALALPAQRGVLQVLTSR